MRLTNLCRRRPVSGMVAKRTRDRLPARRRYPCVGCRNRPDTASDRSAATQPDAVVVTQRKTTGVHEHARRVHLGVPDERRWQRSDEPDPEEPGRPGQRLDQHVAFLVNEWASDLLHVLAAQHRPRHGDLHHELGRR